MANEKDILWLEKTLRGCKIRKEIGRSNLGTLYLIQHPMYGSCVLKYFEGPLVANQKFIKKILEESKSAHQIDHPCVAKIYQVDYQPRPFMIREWVKGDSLEERIKEGILPPIEATDILISIALGLQAAYNYNIRHKNLKPNNIIILGSELKLVDFMLPPTEAYYIAPEQFEGKKSDICSDIYALGVIYYKTLTGRLPFAGNFTNLGKAAPEIKYELAGLPDCLKEIFHKTLACNPAQRYQDPMSFVEALRIVKTRLSDVKNEAPSDHQLDAVQPYPKMLGMTLRNPLLQPGMFMSSENKGRTMHEGNLETMDLTDVITQSAQQPTPPTSSVTAPDEIVEMSLLSEPNESSEAELDLQKIQEVQELNEIGPAWEHLPKELPESLQRALLLATGVNTLQQDNNTLTTITIPVPLIYKEKVLEYLRAVLRRECWTFKDLENSDKTMLVIDLELAKTLRYFNYLEDKIQNALARLPVAPTSLQRSAISKVDTEHQDAIKIGENQDEGRSNVSKNLGVYSVFDTLMDIKKDAILAQGNPVTDNAATETNIVATNTPANAADVSKTVVADNITSNASDMSKTVVADNTTSSMTHVENADNPTSKAADSASISTYIGDSPFLTNPNKATSPKQLTPSGPQDGKTAEQLDWEELAPSTDASQTQQENLAKQKTERVPKDHPPLQEESQELVAEPIHYPTTLILEVNFQNPSQTRAWFKLVKEHGWEQGKHFQLVSNKTSSLKNLRFSVNLLELQEYERKRSGVSKVKEFFQGDYDISRFDHGGMAAVLKLTTKDETIIFLRPENYWAREKFAPYLCVRHGSDGKECVYAQVPKGTEFVVKVAFEGREEALIYEARLLSSLAQDPEVSKNVIGMVQQGSFLASADEGVGQEERVGYYLMMEYASFGNVEQFSQRFPNARLPLNIGLYISYCMMQTLRHLKNRGIIHRDIKPQNILMDGEGVPKLSDFGLAITVGQAGSQLNEERRRLLRLVDKEFLSISNRKEQSQVQLKKLRERLKEINLTTDQRKFEEISIQINELYRKINGFTDQEKARAEGLKAKYRPMSAEEIALKGEFAGSIYYAAPEQFSPSKVLTCQCDIYQMAAVFYNLLTGRPPVHGKNIAEVMGQIVMGTRPHICEILPAIPLHEAVDELIYLMMEHDPEQRITVEKVIEQLENIIFTYNEELLAEPVFTRQSKIKTEKELKIWLEKTDYARKLHRKMIPHLQKIMQQIQEIKNGLMTKEDRTPNINNLETIFLWRPKEATLQQGFRFRCPNCKSKLQLPVAKVGKNIRCPNCQQKLIAKYKD